MSITMARTTAYNITPAELEALEIAKTISDLKQKYFATYAPITRDRLREYEVFGTKQEIAVFDTEQERDDWVYFRDQFSRDMGNTPDNCFLPRRVLSAATAINAITQTRDKSLVTDEINPNQQWYLIGLDAEL